MLGVVINDVTPHNMWSNVNENTVTAVLQLKAASFRGFHPQFGCSAIIFRILSVRIEVDNASTVSSSNLLG